MNTENYKLNISSIANRWFIINASEYDHQYKEGTEDDCFNAPTIIKRQNGLIDAIEEDIFREKDFYELCIPSRTPSEYYTPKEISDGQKLVFRNLGCGWRAYYFEIVYVKIILTAKTCARRHYIVANEALCNREFLSLVKFCQCEKCLYYNKVEQLIRKVYKYISNNYDNAPCLKKGTCDNELLKRTRRVVHTYVPEYAINPLIKLSPKELKKWGKLVSPITPSSD